MSNLTNLANLFREAASALEAAQVEINTLHNRLNEHENALFDVESRVARNETIRREMFELLKKYEEY